MTDMNFSINNNSSAQSILSNLNYVEQQMNNSYQQLSTGNRVNSAADNPASYSISQQMTSQINGLNQATQNSQNGISMIQTATGSMNQIEQVLQTMSTLATEAASAGSTFSDRANLQLEMNALAQQINSTTNQTQYNGINLLTGQFGNSGLTGQTTLTLQIGADQNQVLGFNIGATDANTLGIAGIRATGVASNSYVIGNSSLSANAVGLTTGSSTSIVNSSNISFGSGSILQSGMGLNISMTATVSAVSGTVKTAVASAVNSALNQDANNIAAQVITDYNNAIGSSSTAGYLTDSSNTVQNGIASAVKTFFTSSMTSTDLNTFVNGVLNAFASVQGANGVSGEGYATTGGAAAYGGDPTQTALVTALNDLFQTTGNSSHTLSAGSITGWNTTGSPISSTNTMGTANVSLNNNKTAIALSATPTAATAGDSAVTSLATDISGALQSASKSAYDQLVTPTNSTISANSWDAIQAYYTGTSSQLSQASASIQLETSNGTLIGNAVQVTQLSQPLTIGDTATGATMSVTLNPSSNNFSSWLSNFVTIGTTTASGSFTQADSLSTTGTATSAGSVSNGWSATSNVAGINIMTQDGAQSAITALQSAINNLSSSQAQLGAVQNRLNYTVSNLQNSSQNLQNAQSTITNTDMAQAYTQFSQQQILSQVGIAMLSQAQQAPGMILKLLQ